MMILSCRGVAVEERRPSWRSGRADRWSRRRRHARHRRGLGPRGPRSMAGAAALLGGEAHPADMRQLD